MKPTAISQVLEQVIRVGVIIFAAWLFTKSGTDLYEMGAQAMSGAIWGAGAATIVLLFYFFKRRQPEMLVQESPVASVLSFKRLAGMYLTEGLTICLLTSLLVLFQLVDSFTLYKGLLENEIGAESAKALKGIYDRGQPLVQLGMVVGTGFSAGFIPLMSRAYALQQITSFHRAAKSLIRMTAVFSFAAVAGLLAILPEVNEMLFGDTSGNTVLSVYVLAIAMASIMMAYQSICQSFNQFRLTVIALVIGLLVKLLANHLFIPYWDTLGASFATVIGLVTMVVFLHLNLPLSLRNVWNKDAFLIKLILGAVLLFLSAYATKTVLWFVFEPGRTQATIVALLTVLVGVFVFLIYMTRFKLLTAREWLSIPFGKKVMKKMKR